MKVNFIFVALFNRQVRLKIFFCLTIVAKLNPDNLPVIGVFYAIKF